MKVVGLITEYNPFHNGHLYHLNEAKRITGADYAVVVMSGNFVQRGTPAVINKYSRAEMALKCGVDLVLELPVCYATGSAEYFALGAVSMLDKLGIVDYLCFGSECGDIKPMQEVARLLLDRPKPYEELLQASLKDGFTFPAARVKAIKHYLELQSDTFSTYDLTSILKEPNNILGIEYLKALYQLNSNIKPVTIQRKAAHYHEKDLTKQPLLSEQSIKIEQRLIPDSISSTLNQVDPNEPVISNVVISSATAIRNSLLKQDDLSSLDGLKLSGIKPSVPKAVYDILNNAYQNTFPITEEDFAPLIKYKLLAETRESLTHYVDIPASLADRMKNLTDYNLNLQELSQKIKSKNMTLTRINRALIHLLLNIRDEAFQEMLRNDVTPYARVLGIKKESSHLLRTISKGERIPVITKVSRAEELLDELGKQMLSQDLFAAHIYNQMVYERYKTVIPNEYKHGICII